MRKVANLEKIVFGAVFQFAYFMITAFQLFLQISPQETRGAGKLISSKQRSHPVGKQKQQNREMQEGCCCLLDCFLSLQQNFAFNNILKCPKMYSITVEYKQSGMEIKYPVSLSKFKDNILINQAKIFTQTSRSYFRMMRITC